MTPRSALRKTFEAYGNFAAIGWSAANPADIANFVRNQIKAHNISITRDALALWVPLLSGDKALQNNEIEKMMLYKGYGDVANAEITTEDVKRLAAGGQMASLDAIIMSALSGQPIQCDNAFQRAVEGKVNAAVILRSLQRHISRLLEARMHMDNGESSQSAMRALRPPVFRMQEQDFKRHLNIWPAPMLSKALNQSLETETAIKSAGAPINALINRLLLALASYAKKRR